MTKGTKVTTVSSKAPFVSLQRLRPQDVAGLKLKSPKYKTVETTNGEFAALEDGAQRATKNGDRCLPSGEEGRKEHHCFRCSMNFPNSDTLVLHLKSHGPVRRSCTLYEKEVCGTSLDDSGPQNRRTVTSTSKQGGSSPRMGKKTEFEEIRTSRSGGNRFPCNVCDKVFMQTNHLKLHMRTHSESITDKEQGTGSDENSLPLDTTAFIRMMENVIKDTAIKCFADAFESNNLPSSSDEALDHVRTRAHKALEQYRSTSEGLVDLRQDDLEHILQNVDDYSLDIKQEEEDDDGYDKNVVSVNFHNQSSSYQNSFLNRQANLQNESSVRVPAHTSASDIHTESVDTAAVTDTVTCSVQNVIKSKKFAAVTRNAQERKKFTENVHNVLQHNSCPPHKSSVLDTEKGITTKVSPNKKHSPVGNVPPREPAQTNIDTAKNSEGGEKSKKRISCHICHKLFTLQSHLNLHQRTVHDMKRSEQNMDVHYSEDTDPIEGQQNEDNAKNKQPVFRCNIKSCSMSFNRERDFKLHLNTHQKKGLFNCSLCDKVFPAECLLKKHEKSHSDGLLYNCTKCEKAYELNEDLLLHMSCKHPATKHSPENTNKIIKERLSISADSYKCLVCNIQFTDNSAYEMHMKSDHMHVPNPGIHTTPVSISGSHTGTSLHVCAMCNLIFSNDTDFEHHLNTCPSSVLGKEKALDCSNCSMKFPDDISLELHMKLKHPRLLLKCPRCDLKFPNRSALQSHITDHDTQSPLRAHSKCSKCPLKFSTDALLERHMKLNHSMLQSSNQHACSKCAKKFKNQAVLLRHITLAHSPELEDAKKGLSSSTSGIKLIDAATLQKGVVVKSDQAAQVNSMQRDKFQNIPTSMDNRRNTFQCSKCDMHFNDRNELQPHMKLIHASELESEHSEVNHIEHSSAKNQQPSPNRRKKLVSLAKNSKSNPIPVREKSQTCLQLSETDFECFECNIQFTDFDTLETHMKLNHTLQSPKRKVTNASVAGSEQTPKMKATKTSVTERKQISVQNNVLSSESTSTATNPDGKGAKTVFACSKCLDIFAGNESLQNHITMQHSPIPESTSIFKCLRCDKQFYTSSQFRSHLRMHRKKMCPQCGKCFTTQNSLIKHMRLHSSQLFYKCDRCTSQFSSAVLFKKHLNWHDAEILKAVGDGGNTQKQTETENVPESLASAKRFKNGLDSSSRMDYVEHFSTGNSDDSGTTAHDHLADENSITHDDDSIILSDDEDIVNKENHNTDEVELGETDDEIMMVLDNTSPDHFKELSSKLIRNRTPKLSVGLQTNVLLSDKSPVAFLTDNRNTRSSNLPTADGIGSFKKNPSANGSAVSDSDSFKLLGGVDHSSNMVGTEIVNNSAVSSRKLRSLVGRCRSPDTPAVLSTINGSVSDSQDSVPLENYEIVKKSPNTSPVSSKRKRILKDANQLVGPKQKKGKKLRVSFAADVLDKGSDDGICSENIERTMPKLFPEKVEGVSNKSVASQKNVTHPSLFSNCYVSLTKLEDGTLGGIANKVTKASNKNASFHKRRQSPRNRISGGSEINKDQLQKFNKSLKTGDQKLSLAVEAKNASPSKENNLGESTLLHCENEANKSCEEEHGQMMSKSTPMATSTPLTTNKINHIRASHNSIPSSNEENVHDKDGHTAEDMGPCNKLGLSPLHSESRNRTGTSIEKEKLEPPKRSTYTLKNKRSRIKVGRFKCKVCGKIFQFLSHFRVHKKTHAGQLIHKCPICNDRFPLRFLLGLHIADHFEKGIPRMMSDNKKVSPKSTSKNLSPTFRIPQKKIASTNQDDAAKPKEPSLSNIFSHSSSASTTIDGPTNQIHSLVQNNLLPSCYNKEHSSALTYVNNSNKSNGNYPPDKEFQQCDDSFGYSPSGGKNPYLDFTCRKCDKTFTNFLKLRVHQSMHTGIGLYKCSYCDLMFYFKTSLLSHVKIHSGEKKYACKYCGMQFEECSEMVSHRSNHEVGKPLKCPECPKTFALYSLLGAHMQLHVRRSWYKCSLCNWSFNAKSKFQDHIVGHSEKKPFSCRLCKSSFKRISSCRIHIKRVHIAKNEITLKNARRDVDFVQIDKKIYKELQDFVRNVMKKISPVRVEKFEMKSLEDTMSLADSTTFTGKKDEDMTTTIDKELPEPILVDPRRLLDSSGKEICKSTGNHSFSDIDSADRDKKERYEKLCVEVRNVLTRMKRYSQVPITSPRRNNFYLKPPARQIQSPRVGKSLNVSETKSPNSHKVHSIMRTPQKTIKKQVN